MIIDLQKFPSRLVVNQSTRVEGKKDNDYYIYQAATNPVPNKFDWGFKRGSGNLINTTNGVVNLINAFGRVVKTRPFTSRQERNYIVNNYLEIYNKRGKYIISVEFD